MLAALAVGASGGASNEATGVAVQFRGTRNTNFVGILVEPMEAGTGGSSIDRDWMSDSVLVLKAGGANIGGAGAAVWAWRRRGQSPLVVPIELLFNRPKSYWVRVLDAVSIYSIARADLDDVLVFRSAVEDKSLESIDPDRSRIDTIEVVDGILYVL